MSYIYLLTRLNWLLPALFYFSNDPPMVNIEIIYTQVILWCDSSLFRLYQISVFFSLLNICWIQTPNGNGMMLDWWVGLRGRKRKRSMQERRKEPSNGDAERTVKWRAEGVANKGQSVCRGHFLQCTQSDDDGAKSYDLNSYLILSFAR
jgi:hypothetical protein